MNEDTIYIILQYVQKKGKEIHEQAMLDPPVQVPFSRWAVDEIVSEMKLDCTSYPDEIIRRFISNMRKYEEVAEPERRSLYSTAITTAQDLYSYLFEGENDVRKESIPF